MTLSDLGKILRGDFVSFGDRVINNLQELAIVVEYLKASGNEISATTGVWDLLHVGHCRYLQETKKRGHICLAEVDSDAVVRLRKPDNLHRPVVPLEERLEMLSFMRCVDLLYPLVEGEDPIEFIRVMKPDFFIVSETSQDSKEEYLSLVRPHCGEIVILPGQANVSTTERIRRMQVAGGIDHLITARNEIDRLIVAAQGNGGK